MLKNESKVSIPTLRDLLNLDPETGELRWKERGESYFCNTTGKSRARTAAHAAANWNSHYAGKRALSTLDSSGHFMGRIFNMSFYAHRVVYALTHGNWPKQSIDHINGKPGDNRPKNLRDVSHRINHQNQNPRKNNTSGAMGVSFNKRLQKWQAGITINYRAIHIGFFEEKSDAIEARRLAQKNAGFHENHGRVAA